MSASVTPPWADAARFIQAAVQFVSKYAFELILITIILLTCVSRGLRVGMTIHDPEKPVAEGSVLSLSALLPVQLGEVLSLFDFAPAPIMDKVPKAMNVSLMNATHTVSSEEAVDHGHTTAIDIAAPAVAGQDDFNSVAVTDDPAPHISNLTLILSPDYAVRKKLPANIVTAKKQRVQNYLDRHAAIAQREMREFGVPASITLAQGLLESNAGDSKLARQSNNHFGIKCRSKCLGCTCRNYGDDTRYDMFRVFNSVAESFREHSELLNTERYSRLKKHGTDYKKWAHGLKSCGYATDKRYAHKLIKIIEELNLDAYDETLAM